MVNGQNFDPLFAGAQSALNASQRGLSNLQNQVQAPQLPAQNQAFAQSRSLLNNVAQFSPLNVLASGELPGLGGGQGGQFQLPFLQGGQPPLPPTPQGFPGPDGGPQMPTGGNSAGTSGGNTGGGGTNNGTRGSRSGRGQTRT